MPNVRRTSRRNMGERIQKRLAHLLDTPESVRRRKTRARDQAIHRMRCHDKSRGRREECVPFRRALTQNGTRRTSASRKSKRRTKAQTQHTHVGRIHSVTIILPTKYQTHISHRRIYTTNERIIIYVKQLSAKQIQSQHHARKSRVAHSQT